MSALFPGSFVISHHNDGEMKGYFGAVCNLALDCIRRSEIRLATRQAKQPTAEHQRVIELQDEYQRGPCTHKGNLLELKVLHCFLIGIIKVAV